MKDNNTKKINNFYKNVAKEIGWNFSKINMEKEVFTKFNYWDTVKEHLNDNVIVLDVGCGSAEKVIQNMQAKKVYGVDKEIEMIKKAKSNLKQMANNSDIFEFLLMNGREKLEFNDSFFDVVTSRHCGVNTKELKRVLKQGGVFISEDIDKYDCWELKNIFNRGQNYLDKKLLSEEIIEELEGLGFSSFTKHDIIEVEYYKNVADLEYLLKRTPIINDFGNIDGDYELLDKYVKSNTTTKGIKLERKLFGIVAIK